MIAKHTVLFSNSKNKLPTMFGDSMKTQRKKE